MATFRMKNTQHWPPFPRKRRCEGRRPAGLSRARVPVQRWKPFHSIAVHSTTSNLATTSRTIATEIMRTQTVLAICSAMFVTVLVKSHEPLSVVSQLCSYGQLQPRPCLCDHLEGRRTQAPLPPAEPRSKRLILPDMAGRCASQIGLVFHSGPDLAYLFSILIVKPCRIPPASVGSVDMASPSGEPQYSRFTLCACTSRSSV